MTNNITMIGPLQLRGITVELEGNEGDLLFAPPVVSFGNENFVVGMTGTNGPQLRPLRDRDHEFVRWLPNGVSKTIELSEGVWIVGPRLIQGLSGLETSSLTSPFKSWGRFKYGFRWTTGTYRDYADLMQSYANKLQAALYRSLFYQSRKQGVGVKRVFDLYQAFALEDTLERALDCALFYSETHELRALDLEVKEAVDGKLASNRTEFENKLEALRTRVLSKRLRELVNERAKLNSKTVGGRAGTVRYFNVKDGSAFTVSGQDKSDVFDRYSPIQGLPYKQLEESQSVEFNEDYFARLSRRRHDQ